MRRRSLLLGLGAALAAPAIVRAENIMRVASLRQSVFFDIETSGPVIGVALMGGGPGELITVAINHLGHQLILNNAADRWLYTGDFLRAEEVGRPIGMVLPG